MLEFLPLLALLLIILLYLLGPTFFFKPWMNVMFSFSDQSNHRAPADLTLRESALFSTLLLLVFWLGVVWPSLSI
jgi:NADH:ubiquinone oxidoreductase subunit 4 (subunit M)